MANRFDEHCDLCTQEETCKKSHVYVVQLSDEIAKKKWFMEANPNYDASKSCLYVGKTTHHPLCRIKCTKTAWSEIGKTNPTNAFAQDMPTVLKVVKREIGPLRMLTPT